MEKQTKNAYEENVSHAVAANVAALCEGGIFENLSLHFSTSADNCFSVEN
jgi:hypothetical protein